MPELIIDWTALTFPDAVPVEETQAFFEGTWNPLPKGGHGYRSTTQNGYIPILFDGNPGMGHHLRLTSHGLRQVEAQADFRGWPQFLRDQFQRAAKPSRFDLALDDTEGHLDFATILHHLHTHAYTTRFKGCSHKHDWDLHAEDDETKGEIITLGSRTSANYIRIYDRALRLSLPGHLLRVELESKGRAAIRVAAQVAESNDDSPLGALAIGIIRSLIEFRTPGTDTNLTRAPIAPWWEPFCGGAEKVRLGLGKPPRTIEDTMRWIHRQVGPSLAATIIAMQENGQIPEDWLANVIESGQGRLSQRHKQMIEEYIRSLHPRYTDRGCRGPEADSEAEDPQTRVVEEGGDDDDQ